MNFEWIDINKRSKKNSLTFWLHGCVVLSILYVCVNMCTFLLSYFLTSWNFLCVCNCCFIVARCRSAYCRFPCMVIYMYIEFSPPDFPAVVNTSEGIRCTHLYTSSPTWTTVVSPTKRFSWTFSAVLVKSTCLMRKCGFTEEPNSLCCMFLCMSASCMTLF